MRDLLALSLARSNQRLAVAGLLVVLLVGGGAWWFNRGLPDDVALQVGDTEVSVADLRDRMATMEALYGVTVPDDADEKADFWRDAAHSVAVGVVLDDAFEDEDVAVSGNQVEQPLQQVIATYFGEGGKGQAAFTDALAEVGTSEKAVREELRRQLQVSALFASVTGDVGSPTDADVAQAYEERRCSLSVPEKRRIRNVVTATRADARDLLRRLRNGASFAEVVKDATIDASTRDNGGDLGLVAVSDLEEGYAKAAFSVGKGELFGPVEGEYGWNVGRVDAVQAGRVPSLEESAVALKQTLFSEAQSEAWQKWLGKRLKAADVRYGDAYRPEHPLALPSDALPGGADEPVATDC